MIALWNRRQPALMFSITLLNVTFREAAVNGSVRDTIFLAAANVDYHALGVDIYGLEIGQLGATVTLWRKAS
jgi:hypothetical protein